MRPRACRLCRKYPPDIAPSRRAVAAADGRYGAPAARDRLTDAPVSSWLAGELRAAAAAAAGRVISIAAAVRISLPRRSLAHSLTLCVSASFARSVVHSSCLQSPVESRESLVKMSSAWFAVVCLVLAANNLGQYRQFICLTLYSK